MFQVIPISGIRVVSATQSLLVGAPSPVWVQAGALGPAALGALQPAPRVSWTLRDPAAARLLPTHTDGEQTSFLFIPTDISPLHIDIKTICSL